MSRLRKITSPWKSLFFMGNECKMRKTLMTYLAEEGINCQVKDGVLIMDYNDCSFVIAFELFDDFAECSMGYQCADDDYTKLSTTDKTCLAGKSNTTTENHTIVRAYADSFLLETSFYFTSEFMLLTLFKKHFEEMCECYQYQQK